jgi:uncharacterized protein YkwD
MRSKLKLSRNKSRLFAVTAIVALAALLSSCLTTGQEETLWYLNLDRGRNGVQGLEINADAQEKAQAWAEKLASENTLYHSNLPDGIRTRWCSLGENVGYGPDAETIQAAYMESAGHRANVVSSKWNGVGVGYATNGSRVFTVQVFITTC